MKALFRSSAAQSATPIRPPNSARARHGIARIPRGGIASAEPRNCDDRGSAQQRSVLKVDRQSAATNSTSTSRRRQRVASGLLASAALVVLSVSSPTLPEASARDAIPDDDPISFFQLRGSVAKKYAIEEIEEEGNALSTSSSSPSTSRTAPSASSSTASPTSPSPPPSSRVVKRKAGLTVAACVAEGRGPRGGELNAALASASGAAGVAPPTACGRAEDASRANLPRACAAACSTSCAAAVERKNELLKSTTGFSLSEAAARRLGRGCARACAGECVRPSTSSARAYDFFVNFGR